MIDSTFNPPPLFKITAKAFLSHGSAQNTNTRTKHHKRKQYITRRVSRFIGKEKAVRGCSVRLLLATLIFNALPANISLYMR